MNTKHLSGIALDIDDTLSWTCREWVEYLHTEFGNPENLTPQEFVDKYRLIQRAPYFARDDVLVRVREMCFDPAFHDSVAVVEDALPALKKIEKVILIGVYLTARPESMRKSTQQWLDKHSFPKAELIMCPDEQPFGTASEWKAQVLNGLYPDVIGIIDDNPVLLTHLAQDYQGAIFIYNHDASEVHHPCAIVCSDWSDVVEKVTNYMRAASDS